MDSVIEVASELSCGGASDELGSAPLGIDLLAVGA
jgi:hypothetical protein